MGASGSVLSLLMRLRIAAAVLAVAALGGCSNDTAEQPAPSSSAASTSAVTTEAPPVYETAADRYPGVTDATCAQFSDAYTGDYDLGLPPNEWAGNLLAVLVGQDGIQTTLTGFVQVKFASSLSIACLEPAVAENSARDMGAAEYRAHKADYVS